MTTSTNPWSDREEGRGAFTPGPWRFNGNWLEPTNGNGGMILIYTNMDDGLHGSDADKALIASAPDMYAALETVVSDCQLAQDVLGNSPSEFNSVKAGFGIIADRARAALAKARGETL